MSSLRNLTSQTDEAYLAWLCDKIDCRGHQEYEQILISLYYTIFYSLVPHDDNRGLDGLDLRLQYEEETNIAMPRRDMNRQVNLLEVLIALAEKMAFLIFDPMKEKDPDVVCCFWIFIENLGLEPGNSSNNRRIIHDLLERRYLPSGKGGIFPLKRPQEDQTNIEIWYQMMAYLGENYS